MEKQTFKLHVYSIIQRQKHTNMFASICEDKQTGDATICEEKVKKNGEGQDKTVASLFWRTMDGFLIKDIFHQRLGRNWGKQPSKFLVVKFSQGVNWMHVLKQDCNESGQRTKIIIILQNIKNGKLYMYV